MATTSALGSLGNGTFTVDANGKLKFSGISSGMDWQSIIDAQITAKRAPAIALEAKITANTDKIAAYKDFKDKVSGVVTALDKLRDNPGSSTSVFTTKSVSGTTAAASGTASDINSLMVVSVDNTAQNGTHTVTINSLATAHQLRGDAVSDTTAALTSLGITAGTFTLNGVNIVVSATDTLVDLRAQINNSGAGVSATIVNSDATTNYLVLTATDTGVANAITFGGDAAVTDSLGLTTNTGVDIKNELVAAADANIDVDGITGIQRSSNDIDDVITGFTFSLLKAEPGTTITLDVETDLNAVKTAINDFVEAYNDIRAYVTDQRTASDRNDDGKVDDNELGPLAYDQTVRDILAKLTDLAVGSVSGNPDGFASLGQIGVVMNNDYNLQIDDTILDSKLLTNVANVRKLFAFTSTSSDSRATILGRNNDTASGTYTLNIGGTDVDGNIISANYGGAASGVDDGSATVSGRTIAGAAGGATGLNVFFNGGASLGSQTVTVTISRGLADQFFDYFDNVTKTSTGTLDTAIMQLQTVDADYQSRIDVIDTRLEITRKTLEAKYTSMETALAKLQTLQTTIDNYTAQNNKSD